PGREVAIRLLPRPVEAVRRGGEGARPPSRPGAAAGGPGALLARQGEGRGSVERDRPGGPGEPARRRGGDVPQGGREGEPTRPAGPRREGPPRRHPGGTRRRPATGEAVRPGGPDLRGGLERAAPARAAARGSLAAVGR